MTLKSSKRCVIILHTGAGPQHHQVKWDTKSHEKKNLKLDSAPNVCNASRKPVNIVGTIYLMVQIGRSMELVSYLITDRLTTYVIFGFDFCHRLVQSIKPRLATIEMADGSTLPSVRKPSKANTDVQIPEEQHFSTRKNSFPPKIKPMERGRLNTETNNGI